MAGERTMGDLSRRTGLEPSNLSRHVAALERAGCVSRRRRGRHVVLRIADPSLERLCHLVCGSLRERSTRQRASFG
jgi:DNA-binding transcriptional ArsR family regulator